MSSCSQTASPAPVAPASPCIKVCALDPQGHCQGCFRTLDEIARWQEMTPEEQWQLIARLGERRAAFERLNPRG